MKEVLPLAVLRSPLKVPDVQAAMAIGLNVFAVKLLVESVPVALATLEKMGVANRGESGLELVLTAKDGVRYLVTIVKTDEPVTLGDGAL